MILSMSLNRHFQQVSGLVQGPAPYVAGCPGVLGPLMREFGC